MEINFRVEYEDTPIRHAAVQCPFCQRWFVGYDILTSDAFLRFKSDLQFAVFRCPVCNREFSGYNAYNLYGDGRDSGFAKIRIQECNDHTEVYNGCIRKKEVWE